MKKTFLRLMALTLITAALTGCGSASSKANSDSDDIHKTEVYNALANAKTVFDIADYLTKTSNALQYSECEKNDKLMLYFGVLLPVSKKYIIVTQNDEKYILFNYTYSDYGSVISNINGMEKSYGSDNLTIRIDKSIDYVSQEGCEPLWSDVNCIVKLEQDIDKLIVDEQEYEEYSGGLLYVNGKYGVVDDNMNIIVPIKYDIIRDLDSPGSDRKYYFCHDENGSGVLDENYDIMLQPIYSNIFFINDNKFVVMKTKGDNNSLSDYQIGIIDGNENLIHDYIDGFIDGGLSFNNNAHQVVFGRMKGEKFLKGVIDDSLNVIIEPIYNDVAVFGSDMPYQFYVVENNKEKFAVIDSSGIQKTEFEGTSVYDVKTKYYESLR